MSLNAYDSTKPIITDHFFERMLTDRSSSGAKLGNASSRIPNSKLYTKLLISMTSRYLINRLLRIVSVKHY